MSDNKRMTPEQWQAYNRWREGTSEIQSQKGVVDLLLFGSFGRECPKCGFVYGGITPATKYHEDGCKKNSLEHLHVSCFKCEYEMLTEVKKPSKRG